MRLVLRKGDRASVGGDDGTTQRQAQPQTAAAVGGAVGHNPISIIVPCHRVIGANGSLTGYAGGIDKKTALLTLEGVDVGRLTLSKCKTKCNAP